MHKMTRFRNHDQLKFALHLSYHERFIETIGACENEKFGSAAGEKFGREVLEPFLPPGLCG